MVGLFDGAEFGDKYKTRDGRCVKFIGWDKFKKKIELELDNRESIFVHEEGIFNDPYIDDRITYLSDRMCGIAIPYVRYTKHPNDVVSRWED